jgi:FG-GAP repeat
VSSKHRVWIVLSSLSIAGSALGQGLFREHDGQAGSRLGLSSGRIGDLDGDGCDDYAIGAPYEMVGAITPGVVRVHSGKTGATLLKLSGFSDGDEFGWTFDAVGDIDQDGTPDLIVGAIGSSVTATYSGSAYVISGATGATLFTFHGEKPWNFFGADVEGLGDLDQDGYPDFGISAPRTWSETGSFPSTTPGLVIIYSGKTGAVLYRLEGLAAADAFGVLCSPGDVNGDGRGDFVVGTVGWVNAGSLNVYSGSNGALLYTVQGNYPGDDFAWSIVPAGDANGDGLADFAVAAPGWDAMLAGWPVSGEVTIRSGANGAILNTIPGSGPRDLFGSWMAHIGDANGDGFDDLAIAASPLDAQTDIYGNAYVRVVTAKTGATLHTYAVDGETQYDLVALCSDAGDVNGDGFDDFIACSQVEDDAGVDSGEAKIHWLSSSSCGTFTSYGSACTSPGGSSPTLTLSGCPTAGGYVTLSLKNGPPNSLAYLALGFSANQIAIGGGCTWYIGTPLPTLIPLPLSGFGPQQGSITLEAMIPLGAPAFELHHQAIVLDPNAVLGFTTTNAVKEVVN